MHYEKRSTCRVCGAEALTPILTLGAEDAYVICDSDKNADACGHIQRATDMHQTVSTNKSAPAVSFTHRHRLRAIATSIMEMVNLREGRALDVGCGDGTLMGYFPPWVETMGIDITCAPKQKREDEHHIHEVFPSQDCLKALTAIIDDQKFDIITAVDVIGESQDPQSFLDNIKELLNPEGIIILETPYASLCFMRDSIGSFHPRAVNVFTLASLEQLAKQAGLKIIRGSMTDTAGGALRVYLSHEACLTHDYAPWLDQLARLWDEEQALCLTKPQTSQAFRHRFENNRLSVDLFVEKVERQHEYAIVVGKTIQTLARLKYFELGANIISAMVSYDEDDWDGELQLENGDVIDIIGPDEAKLLQPDYIIAPSELRREFLERWRDCIYNGVKFVFLTPELEIIDEQSYATALGRCLAVTDAPGSLDTLKAVLSTVQRPRLVAINETPQSGDVDVG